jgi:glycosyltransferase involved in cell wall biosynthesis
MSSPRERDASATAGRRLRVLLLFDSTFPYQGGGRETGLYHICKYGHDQLDVRIITMKSHRGNRQMRFAGADRYCEIHPTGSFRSLANLRGYTGLARLADVLLFPMRAGIKGRRVTRRWRPEVVLCFHASPVALVACKLARRLGAKSVINMRSFYSREIALAGGRLKHFLWHFRPAEQKAVRGVDLILANGEDTYEYASSIRGDDRPTVLVHNGVDTELFRPQTAPELRSRLGWDDCAIFISNNPLRAIKGPQDAIAAVARVPEDVRRRCRVIFFAKNERDFASYRAQAESLGVSKQVVALGYVQHHELPAYLNASDVALHPILFSAGTTHASLETLACGLPQLSYDSASLRSTCLDGETGILVPAGDVDGLARGMTKLAADVDGRQRMGAAARQRSLDFDWHKYVTRYVAALTDLVGRSPGLSGESQ